MKHLFPFFALSLVLVALPSCEPNEPIPDSFPKKQLIEEFTGQTCGYCPYGMDCIHDFIGNDTNFVLLLHHYGYQQDHFTVAGSKTITNALKVSGAPSVSFNRAKVSYKDGGKTQSAVVFHPGYLPDADKSQFENTTYASVNIRNTYDPASRELKIKVSGAFSKKDIPSLNLTVLIKESGMIDTQSDYYKTFEGWQEFRHANAVRAFLTEAKGDPISVSNQRYSEEYTLTLKDSWVPENCMVVAFLSEEFQPVVQANQKPVVACSKGGADILHGGITPVPVADYYPEPNATSGPQDISHRESDSLAVCDMYVEHYPAQNLSIWTLQAYNTSYSVTISRTASIPFVEIYLVTSYDPATTLPTSTFQFTTEDYQVGSAIAGYRDDANAEIGGSQFYFISKSYFNQGYLVPTAQWLINSGSITIAENGWSLEGTARNGAEIHLVGAPITAHSAAPTRRLNMCLPQDNQE